MAAPDANTLNAWSAQLPADFAGQSMSLPQIFAILRAYRFSIVLIAGIITALGIGVSLILPKSYDATATLIVDFQVNDPITGGDFPSMLAASYMSTQVGILKSPEVLLPVVDELGLTKDPKLQERFAGSGAGAGSLRDFAAAQFIKNLTIGQKGDSRLIHVSYTSKTPEGAARGANTVAQVYIQTQLDRASRPAQERSAQYTKQVDALRVRVDAAQDALAKFREENNLIDVDLKVDIEAERLADLTRRLTESESLRRTADLRLQQTQRQRASSGAVDSDRFILDSGLIQTLKANLVTKEAELTQLSRTLGRNHPQHRALTAEVESLRAQVREQVEVYVAGMKSEAQAASSSENSLRDDVEAQREIVLESRRLRDQAAHFVRELESAQKIYNAALESYDRILIGAESRYNNASIVSSAIPPLLPSKPSLRLNAVLSLFLGFFIGVASALVREMLNRRVHCREDVERTLGVPVLAELGQPKPLLSW